jgi:hypothetical protein
MKKNKKIIILIIFIVCIMLVSIYFFFKEETKKEYENFIMEMKQVKSDYNLYHVSGEMLINNKLISNKYTKYSCYVITSSSIKKDCNEAHELTLSPQLSVIYLENGQKTDYKNYLNNNDEMTFKLFNVNNYQFKGIYFNNNLISMEENLKISDNMQSGIYEYRYNDQIIPLELNIDTNAPVLKYAYIIDNKLSIKYQDESGYTIYYYLSKDKIDKYNNIDPNNFVNNYSDLKYESGLNYLYVFAKDFANNQSDIIYVGEINLVK